MTPASHRYAHRRTLATLADTARLGALLAAHTPRDAVLLLSGEMGAGKTTLTKAVCAAWGIAADTVISPTYTLVNIYPGPVPVYHVDLFRLEATDALAEMDPADWINPAGPTLIEWPEVALPLLEGLPLLGIRLTAAPDAPAQREAALSADDPRFAPLFEALAG